MGTSRPYVFLHFIVLIWGFSGILGMLISIPAVEVVFYRVLLSALALAMFIFWSGRNFHETGTHGISRQLATGILIAIHWVLFFLSARVSNVSICLAGMATCSLWTALMDPFFYKRRIQGIDVLLSVIAVIGMVIIFNVEFKYWLGLVLAIASAFVGSLFTIINAKFIDQGKDPFIITFYEMSGATVIILLFFPIYSNLNGGINLSFQGLDYLWMAILALVCTVYAYSISVQLMKHITPFTMNLTVNLEPVYGIILAVMIFGSSEEMSYGFYLGTGVILLAVLAYPVVNRIKKRKQIENRHSAS